MDRVLVLHDVAGAIVASGYAVPVTAIRRHVPRREQIEVLSCDPRLDLTAYKSDMVQYVMWTYNVRHSNAKKMLHLARKMREENNGRV